MKFTLASAVAGLAIVGNVAADCSSSLRHQHHKKRQAVTTVENVEMAYTTVYVDRNGNRVDYTATTVAESVVTTVTPSSSSSSTEETSTEAPAAVTTSSSSSSSSSVETPAAQPTTTSSSSSYTVEDAQDAAPSTEATISETASSSSSSTTSSSSSTTSAASSTSTSVSSSAWLDLFVDPSTPFPDGYYSCDEFPVNEQGIVELDYLGLSGWTGIQLGDGTSTTCVEGAYCSYACQPGMSKTQWPSAQPADGQSRGGLLCSGGKLYLTNSDSQYLCEWGHESGFVVNTLSESVSICRTDYPGSENMNIPTTIAPGEKQPLSVVDEDTYYKWQGALTSSQYYVNKAGRSAEEVCLWGDYGDDFGNWAPLNFGAGYTGNTAWLSLIPNPNYTGDLGYKVNITASPGSVMNGECWYANGEYSGGSSGCTVAVTSGSAYFYLYE
ncbi:Sperm-associated antigen 4 protein [Saitoella coloradoensis]